MQPLIPPPPPPPTNTVAPLPPANAVAPPPPVTSNVAPAPLPTPNVVSSNTHQHEHMHNLNLHGVGDETIDARHKFNPYKFNTWDFMFFLGIVAGFVVSLGTLGVSLTFFLYVLMIIWGFIAGSVSWGRMGKWCVKKDGGLILWQHKWFPIKCFKGDAKKIRIDSYVMENRPESTWDNTVYSIHQAKVSSYLMFGILFLITPKISGSTNWADFISSAYMLAFLSPIVGAIIVPLYIFSDSSVVEVVPGERDFAPIGMTARQFLNSFVRWGLIGLISLKLLPVLFTSDFSNAIITMVFIMSIVAATVLAASFSYSNKRHLDLVHQFNCIWFEFSVDQDHTFKQIDENAYIVMPRHLLEETITHLEKTMGTNFAHVPPGEITPQHSPTITQYSPPPPGLATAPPPPSTISSQGAPPPPN